MTQDNSVNTMAADGLIFLLDHVISSYDIYYVESLGRISTSFVTSVTWYDRNKNRI